MRKILFVMSLIASTLIADTTFRVMSYNALNFDGTSTDRTSHFKDIIEYDDPDIIVMQEIIDQSGANLLLNSFNQINNEYSACSFVNGSDTDNMLYFKSAEISLLSQSQISTALRDISEYVLSINDNEFRIFSCHLKASDGTTNEALRLNEILELRDHLDTLPAGTEYLIVGDMNFYSSSEPAYQNLTVTTPLISEDICLEVGSWHNSSSYSDVHTQSTRVESFGGGATGGLDDKFDFIFANYGMNNNSGIDYVPESFVPIGNDGNLFNQSINNGTNSAAPAYIADALYYASDHLPVSAEFISIGGASQPSGDLIISEYVEGSSNNKYLEIYNGTGNQINLSIYDVVIYYNGSAAPGSTIELSGILADDNVYVLANSSATIWTGTPDQTSGSLGFNGDDVVALRKNSSSIDVIGKIGQQQEWGSEFTSTQDNTLRRKNSITAGDPDGTNDFEPSIEWDGFAQNTVEGLGSHTMINPTVSVVVPNGGENWERNSTWQISWISSDIGQNVKIELYKDNEEGYTTLIESTSNDGNWSWQIPADYQMAADYKIKISDVDAPAIFDESDDLFQISGRYLISEIQTTVDGEDGDSPFAGQNISTFGVVTAVSTYGYFLQDGSGAWNGIFVYDTVNNTALGDSLHITGLVFEYNDKTELKDLFEFTVMNSSVSLPLAYEVSCFEASHEKFEGVLIKVLDSSCTDIDLGYGEWLVNDGTGDLIVDDLIYPYTPILNESYNLTGIIDYSYDHYKLEPRSASDIEIITVQPEQPENVIIDLLYATDQVKITWQNEGYTYKIFSNDEPDTSFPDGSWNLELTVQNSGEAIFPISGNKKFFVVVAVN